MDPWMLFCESKSQVREEKFPREEGMQPERLFSDRIRISSGEEIRTSGGIDPTNDELFARRGGMPPVSVLFVRMTVLRIELLPSEEGMSPVRLLLARNKTDSLESVPNPFGMIPCSLLLNRWIF
ncbi:hypothetical protein PAHAL_4G100400 [Panicum hallii]|uniref:Uncharacterized protein n=1 Tax=Panicum hallii TaxID=206008 RepID=A0A2T8JCE9_9POAL|nr:hypothetical protein PAHAL_4G100400 [Panicum hallii]